MYVYFHTRLLIDLFNITNTIMSRSIANEISKRFL